MRIPAIFYALSAYVFLSGVALAQTPSPQEIVQGAIDNWRGTSSYQETTMIVHRPDWERKTAMTSITRGRKDAILRFTAPPKDAGNATLKLDNDMWVFTPRLNQVIKLPASMMAQSWMGSDFSYNDLAKSDQIVTDYTLTLQNMEKKDGHDVYVIMAVPHPDAPIVWGKEILRIRDDFVLMERQYYDQEGTLVRRFVTDKIAPVDGRPFPVEIRMIDAEKEDHWTLLVTDSGRFNVNPPDYTLTLSNLRNPRGWKP
tara:strand:- start:354 stop:1121 length:768 start_codon:yes stop_codon:yes gene_type:complete